MNENRTIHPAPRWFTPAAIGALLWELLGCGLLVSQAVTVPSTLPPDQQAIWNATPLWMHAAWAFAVVTGTAGAILLLIRRRRATALLLVSFLAVAAQFSGLLLVPELKNLVTSDDLLVPFLVILVSYGVWHLARVASKQGWLR
jgi:hypothetical protein